MSNREKKTRCWWRSLVAPGLVDAALLRALATHGQPLERSHGSERGRRRGERRPPLTTAASCGRSRTQGGRTGSFCWRAGSVSVAGVPSVTLSVAAWGEYGICLSSGFEILARREKKNEDLGGPCEALARLGWVDARRRSSSTRFVDLSKCR
ncbi:hypothetical protein DMC30DRAFT_177305 [Rhodotorula diobovata]|uniref:Uncharacterized protein n=1 Tax=Rhodotorula diobovata TaxID=5288 RepID=A0A5C5FYK8_9BASI|nr:hypothetical protein DMC30DRAFT_177305 [Rhodotorula diobovata]